MLKGAQKRMIVVRTTDSKLFEEAYFVMRHDTDHGGGDRPDLLAEANRILEGSRLHTEKHRRPRHGILWCILGFLGGALLGGGGVGLLWLLL